MEERERGAHRRIIPARAGFTSGRPAAWPPKWDHPRSRGVYEMTKDVPEGLEGSSPLARGLPVPLALGGRHPRIIPARAGFTSGRRLRRGPDQDHPRSRGVYAAGVVADARLPWIIPARAGFTPARPGAGHRAQDHPRSRGVYHTHPHRSLLGPGSSPLARGLLGQVAMMRTVSRIIPARAGFTTHVNRSGKQARDHPRSRGVYR